MIGAGPSDGRTAKGLHVADEKTIALNRRARHDYTIEETFEAGIVLTGTEIKSIRAGKVNLSDAYARIERDEAWLIGAHIAPFEQANRYNHEPKRIRKLLLHRGEVDERRIRRGRVFDRAARATDRRPRRPRRRGGGRSRGVRGRGGRAGPPEPRRDLRASRAAPPRRWPGPAGRAPSALSRAADRGGRAGRQSQGRGLLRASRVR